jgi:hypothetical protein
MFSEIGQIQLKEASTQAEGIWFSMSKKDIIKRNIHVQKINEVLWELARSEPESFTPTQVEYLQKKERQYYSKKFKELKNV